MSAVLSASAPVSSVSTSAASAAIASVAAAVSTVSSVSTISTASNLQAFSSLLTSANTSANTNANSGRLPVLHRTAQPISVDEFHDALRAASPPRFPNARCFHGRRVGIAISGGVDSMALAYLCSQLYPRVGPRLKDVYLAEALVTGFNAMIVNHNLREGSAAEAEAVFRELNKMRIRSLVINMKWPEAEGPESTALETNARRHRYRLLAHNMTHMRVVSLLLAHHEDDQYETVLMRLLSGYGLNGGIRGLRGMRPANDIPECYGVYGAHRSGFWSDQNERFPYVQLVPTRRERERMQADLMSGVDYGVLADEIRAGGGGAWDRLRKWDRMHAWEQRVAKKNAAPLSPMHTEDMGIIAYRPLLGFAKSRLVATCMANGVRWFEDHTNADPTLTMRNALRHMVRTHTLPKALQKPAVLQLAARCDATVRQQEADARHLVVKQGMLRDFSPNVGTLVVRLSPIGVRIRPRPWQTRATASYDAAALAKRRLYMRTLAALCVRILLSYVTPEENVTPVSQLQWVVDALFPELADASTRAKAAGQGPPKGFSVCGVQFAPLASPKTKTARGRAWHLSRAPHLTTTLERVLAASASVLSHAGPPSNLPPPTTNLPFATFPALVLPVRWNKNATDWEWSRWGNWVLFDGRFWIRMRSRLPFIVTLQPFTLEHSKPFRAALAAEHPDSKKLGKADLQGSQLTRLQNMLKAHAPGKVRYTLPGIYVASDIGWALRGESYWPADLAVAGRRMSPDEETARRIRLVDWERSQREQERQQWAAPDRPTQHLLALPTIGVHVPGLDKHLQWEVRYKKVDTGLPEAIQREACKDGYWGWH